MINNEGKEMINDYAVQNEVFVGNRRYLFAIHKNDKEPQRFLKCQCYDDELFRHYVNAVTSNDFVECMKLYLADISAAVEKVEKCYSEQIVAEKYIQIYDSMTNKNR